MDEIDEEENRRKLMELQTRPWRSACRLCPGMLYCTDTEEEARRLVDEHIATTHQLTDVWRDHADFVG